MPSPELVAAEIRRNNLEADLLELKVRESARALKLLESEPRAHGQFHLVGPIVESTVHNLIASIDAYLRRAGENAPVEIIMNSGGGHVLDGLALVDYLRLISARGHEVTIIGYGLVASMAGAVMEAADVRVMTPRCWFGIHEVSSEVRGSISVQEDGVKFAKDLQAQVEELLCERSSLTRTKLKNLWARKDVYMGAAECLKLGLIDRIETL